MGVFGEIDYDGRVQRAGETLGGRCEVTVVSIDSGRGYRNPGFRSHPVAVPPLKRAKGLRHLYFWLRFWMVAATQRPDLVYAHDYFMTLPGWLAARLAGARLHYDAHELIIPGDEPLRSRRERFFYALERWVVRRADGISAANAERAELMRQHYRLPRLPLVVRNLPARPTVEVSADEIGLRYPLLKRRPGTPIRLVFQGDMSLDRGIGAFVSAMRHLDSRFELVLVGGGPDFEALQRQIAAEGTADRVLMIGRVPRDEVFSILRTCDAGIVTYSMQGLNNIYCAPNKLYEYAQAGLPVVVTAQPSLQIPVTGYGIGVVVEDDASARPDESIARAILRLAEDLPAYRLKLPGFLADNRWEEERERLEAAVSQLC